jgi:hypothetical protein
MTPISISSLNLAAKHMVKISTVSPKSYMSYTIPRKSYTEQSYYSHALYNQPSNSQVSNNAGGQVESSEMHFVKNSANSHTSIADVDESKFVPSVSSDSNISGVGHSQV